MEHGTISIGWFIYRAQRYDRRVVKYFNGTVWVHASIEQALTFQKD